MENDTIEVEDNLESEISYSSETNIENNGNINTLSFNIPNFYENIRNRQIFI